MVSLKTQYLQSLDPTLLKKEIALAVKSVKSLTFRSIAFRGVSGALVAPIVAVRLKKGLIVVRKRESQHSTYLVEGHRLIGPQKYIIIDDFPSTGDTIKEIMKEIKANHNQSAKCVGVYFYSLHHILAKMSKKDIMRWQNTLGLKIIRRKIKE